MLPVGDHNGAQVLASGSQTSVPDGLSEIREAYQRNSNWWTVYACFDLDQFEGTVAWISGATGLSPEDVEEALEALCVLGHLQKNGDRYVEAPGRDFVSFDFESKTRAEAIEQHALVSQQILNELGPTQKTAFDHRCLAANDEIILELYKDISKAFEKAFAKARNSKATDKIFKMTFTAVDVLKRS